MSRRDLLKSYSYKEMIRVIPDMVNSEVTCVPSLCLVDANLNTPVRAIEFESNTVDSDLLTSAGFKILSDTYILAYKI